jgi:hypothetical protein
MRRNTKSFEKIFKYLGISVKYLVKLFIPLKSVFLQINE